VNPYQHNSLQNAVGREQHSRFLLGNIVLEFLAEKSIDVKKHHVESRGKEYNERWKPNWIGHILYKNCLLKHVIEGKIDGRI
jgi:hypothetical protein